MSNSGFPRGNCRDPWTISHHVPFITFCGSSTPPSSLLLLFGIIRSDRPVYLNKSLLFWHCPIDDLRILSKGRKGARRMRLAHEWLCEKVKRNQLFPRSSTSKRVLYRYPLRKMESYECIKNNSITPISTKLLYVRLLAERASTTSDSVSPFHLVNPSTISYKTLASCYITKWSD
jgi:hypothetical protein